MSMGERVRPHINLPGSSTPNEAPRLFVLDSCLKLTGPLSLELLGGNTTDAWALLDRRAPNTKPWKVKYTGSIWQCRYLVTLWLVNSTIMDIEMLIKMASTSEVYNCSVALWKAAQAPFEGLKAFCQQICQGCQLSQVGKREERRGPLARAVESTKKLRGERWQTSQKWSVWKSVGTMSPDPAQEGGARCRAIVVATGPSCQIEGSSLQVLC